MRQIITAMIVGALAITGAAAKPTKHSSHKRAHHASSTKRSAPASSAAPAADARPPADRANAALADFGVAYVAWQTERRCNALDEETHGAFLKAIDDDVTALSAVFGQPVVLQMALAAPKPQDDACDSTGVNARAGLAVALQVIATAKSLPPGFKAGPAAKP